MRGWDVATSDPIQYASNKEHPEGGGEAENEKPDSGSDDRDEQYRASAVSVWEPPENGRKHQLHDGVGREEQPHHARRGMEAGTLGVEGKNRDDDAEPHKVDEDCCDNDDQRRTLHIERV